MNTSATESAPVCSGHDFQFAPNTQLPAGYCTDEAWKDLDTEYEYVPYRCTKCGELLVKTERR